MLDSTSLTLLTAKFLISVLILVRVSGMFASGPFWSNAAIPMQVKIILIVILTASISSAYWNDQPQIDFHLWNLVLMVFKEFLAGAAIGFSMNLVFWAVRLGGGLIDFDMGYQTSVMFDSESGAPTLVGEFYYLAALMMFIILNGHHFMIEALFMSLKVVPLTTFTVSESTVRLLITMSTSILIIGIKIAAPMIITLFCTNLALTLLARVAPQTNIFMLSFQVKITVGLMMLFVSVPLLFIVIKLAMETMQNETMKILISLNPSNVVS